MDFQSREITTGFITRQVSESITVGAIVPELIEQAGEDTKRRFVEFFAAHIRNRNTREAYRCMMTGCKLLDVVEAAHIKPYRGPDDNHPENGLLLRSDIHTLFDLNLIGINPETWKVELNEKLLSHQEYRGLSGCHLRLPDGFRPSKAAARSRYKEFKKKCCKK